MKPIFVSKPQQETKSGENGPQFMKPIFVSKPQRRRE